MWKKSCFEADTVPFVCNFFAGSFTPSVLLEGFVREAGAALSTVRELDMSIDDSRGSAGTSAMIIESLQSLANACPTLKRVTSRGTLYPAMLCQLGQVCPELSELFLLPTNKSLEIFPEILVLLPTLLPQVTCLGLPEILSDEEVLDFSQHKSVTTLELDDFSFTSELQWQYLPPNLQHLKCEDILAGPPAIACGRQYLISLLSITMWSTPLPVESLAQLICAAPRLQFIRDQHLFETGDDAALIIVCPLSSESTPMHLATLRNFMQTSMTEKQGMISLHICESLTASSAQIVMDAFPCMTLVKICHISDVAHTAIASILKAFPNVQQLELIDLDGLDDRSLQDLAACSKLTRLTLNNCHDVSPMGLVALCLRHPALVHVCCDLTNKLDEADLEMCKSVLLRYGLVVKMEER